ncbi:MAG: hypothetical protein AB1645_03990 [Bacillota bacterium]|jgi:hypothetical protein
MHEGMPPLFDMTPEQRDQIIESVAQRIFKLGMATPAMLFLEGHKHLGRIAGNTLHVLSPGLGVLFPMVDHYGQILQDKDAVMILVERLQELEEERVRQERALRQERRARALARKRRALGLDPEPGPDAGAGGGEAPGGPEGAATADRGSAGPESTAGSDRGSGGEPNER